MLLRRICTLVLSLALTALSPIALVACATSQPVPVFRPDAEIAEISRLEVQTVARRVSSPATESLRVASLNVYMPADTAELAERLRGLGSPVEIAGIDVWLLQEIETMDAGDLNAVGVLAERLGMNWVFAPTRTTSDGDTHGLAILSRYPIVRAERLWLPRFELAWRSRDRAVLAATLDLGETMLRVYNAHLDTRLNFEERLVQLQPILDDAELHERVVVGGDFNSNSFMWVGGGLPTGFDNQAKRLDRAMTKRGYSTPFAELGGTAVLGMRLDSIYARGVNAREPAIHEPAGGSDHGLLSVLLTF